MHELITISGATVLKDIKVDKRTVSILAPSALASLLAFALTTPEQHHVVLPILVVANTTIYFWVVLWNRDKMVPMFDIGTITMAAYSCYALIPFLGFLFSDMTYTPLSAVQLYAASPTPEEFGAIAWRYVVYMVSFAIVYLIVRGRVSIARIPIRTPDRVTIMALGIVFLLSLGFLSFVGSIYAIDFNAAYDSSLGDNFSAFIALPLLLKQIVQNLIGITFVLKLGLLIILVANFHSRTCRYVLIFWLGAMGFAYVMKMGARTELVLTILSVVLLYHRLVKPVRTSQALIFGIALLTSFLVLGIIRGEGDLVTGLQSLVLIASLDIPLTSVSNEFEGLFGGTYDLYRMREAGLIENVPWQIYAHEMLVLVPQQFLPVEKIDPQWWYLELTEYKGYFMYGPVAQAVLGLDWLELVLRGGVLGWLMGLIHRWYAGRANEFWPSMFYLFTMVYAYYTIRSSTFGFVYTMLYRFIPSLVAVYCVRFLIDVNKQYDAVAEQATFR